MAANVFKFKQSGTDALQVGTETGTEVSNFAGLTATVTELNYVHNVTSAIQTQLNTAESNINTKMPLVSTDNITAAGAISTSTGLTTLSIAAGGAVTLGVPTLPAQSKVITLLVAEVTTMALTNVVGGSMTTTATFSNIGDTLVLISTTATSGKWVVLKEFGVVLS